MFKLFKKFVVDKNACANEPTIDHFIEILLKDYNNQEDIITKVDRRELSVLEEVLNNRGKDLKACVQFRFFDVLSFERNGKVYKRISNNFSNSYFFGSKVDINLMIKLAEYNDDPDAFYYDDYMVGGVHHPLSGLITPIYNGDVILDRESDLYKEKIKRIDH